MSSPRRLLVLFAHPALQKSRINVHLLEAARRVPGVTVHDLYETYPNFIVDVAREQQLLRDHDVIVFQHPFYWYSCPALLKEWLDLVLEYGFAYGRDGVALRGKTMLHAITTGGSNTAYSRGGHNHFTIRELLAPMEQTGRLCGMTWLPPFVVHGTIHLTAEPEIVRHAEHYATLLSALQDPQVKLDGLADHPELTATLLASPSSR